MEFIKKHIYKILLILIILLLFKSCQSCSRQRDIESLNCVIDSIENVNKSGIQIYIDSIDNLNLCILKLNSKIASDSVVIYGLNERISELKTDKNNLRKNNTALINKVKNN